MTPSLRRPLLVLAVVAVGALAPAIFQGRIPAQTDWVHTYGPWVTPQRYTLHNPVGGDSFYVYLPDRLVAVREWKRGSLPLWNPYPSGGLPILGGQTANPLDPLIVLMVFLPLGTALGLNYAVLVFAAGAGLVLYLRDRGIRSPPALALGGVAFALSGYFVYWLELRVFLAGLALLPTALWALERVLENRAVRPAAVLACCVGYSALAGTLQLLALFLLVLVLRALWVLGGGGAVPPRTRAATLAGAGMLVGLVLGILPIVAGLELLGQSARGLEGRGYYDDANFLHWRAAALWFNPRVFGWPSEGSFMAGPLFNRTLASSSGWGALGLIPLWLALIALVRRVGPRRERLFWGGLWGGTLGFLLLMGTPVYGALGRLWPGLHEVDLLRGLIVVNLAGSVLAGHGAEELARLWGSGARRGWIAALGVYLLAAAGLVLLARADLETPNPPALDLLPLALAGGLVLLAGLLPPRGGAAGWRMWILVLATAVELGRVSFLFNTFAPADSAYPENTRTAELEQRLGPPAHYRFLAHRHWRFLPPNTGAVFGLSDVRGYSNIPISRYRLLLESAEGHTGFRNQVFLENVSSPVYRLLGVAYVFTGSSLDPRLFRRVPNWRSLYRRRDPLPRAFLVHRAVTVEGEAGMRSALSDSAFDPASVVYLETGTGALPELAPAVRTEGLALSRMDPSRVRIKADLSAPGILVMTDVYYPGWRATLDGTPAPIFPANWGLRGIPVPAGYHEIDLAYRPSWLLPGLGLSALALLAITAGLCLPSRLPPPGASPGG